jgi:hypothetical protein
LIPCSKLLLQKSGGRQKQHVAGINYTYEVDRRVPTRTHVERPATSIRINQLADDSIKHIIPYRIQVKRKAKKARYSEWFTGHHA